MFKKKNVEVANPWQAVKPVKPIEPVKPVKPLEFVSTCYTKRPFVVVAERDKKGGFFYSGNLIISKEGEFVIDNVYEVSSDLFLELYDPIETPSYLADRVIPEGYFYYRAKPVVKTAFHITKEWIKRVMKQDNKMKKLEALSPYNFTNTLHILEITARAFWPKMSDSAKLQKVCSVIEEAFDFYLGGYLVRESNGEEYFVRGGDFERLYEKTNLDNKESILFDVIAIQEKARYNPHQAFLTGVCEGDYILTLTTKRESIIVKKEVFKKDYEWDRIMSSGYKHKREFAKVVKITPSNIKELASLIGENTLKDDHIQIGNEYATYGNHIALYKNNYYILEGDYFTKTFDIL